MHRKALGAREGRLARREHCFKFMLPFFGVCGGGYLASKGHRNATLNWQGAGDSARPTQDVTVRPKVGLSRDPKGLVHLNTRPRNARLHHRRDRRCSVADGARALAIGADHKTGFVDETQHRQMKTITKIDKTPQFLRRFCGHSASIVHTVVAYDRD